MPGTRRIAISLRSPSTGSATETGDFARSFVQIVPEIIRRTLNVGHGKAANTARDLTVKMKNPQLRRRGQSACVRSFTSFRMTVLVELSQSYGVSMSTAPSGNSNCATRSRFRKMIDFAPASSGRERSSGKNERSKRAGTPRVFA